MADVLIIDDDPDGCEAVAGYLTKAGHAVHCVASGDEALAYLTQQVPRAILLDIRMPGMDGMETLRTMRAYLRWGAVPVAVLTAYPEDPRLWRLADHGVTRVFAKSKVNLDELLMWVEEQSGKSPPPPGDDPVGRHDGV